MGEGERQRENRGQRFHNVQFSSKLAQEDV